ncbi:MAG TPA: hypothetical protein VIK81_02090 [Patescibacteria group bacterium]
MSLIKLSKEKTLKELGLSHLTDDQQNQAWQLIVNIVGTRVLDEILKLLSEEDKKTFLEFLEENEVHATEFLKLKIDNLDRKLSEFVQIIKNDLKGEIENVRE